MSPEAVKLYEKLSVVEARLFAAKRFLEEVREVGVKAQEQVIALKTEEHSIKDQLAALAKEEAEVKK